MVLHEKMDHCSALAIASESDVGLRLLLCTGKDEHHGVPPIGRAFGSDAFVCWRPRLPGPAARCRRLGRAGRGRLPPQAPMVASPHANLRAAWAPMVAAPHANLRAAWDTSMLATHVQAKYQHGLQGTSLAQRLQHACLASLPCDATIPTIHSKCRGNHTKTTTTTIQTPNTKQHNYHHQKHRALS